jgi:hypothetical protein
MEFSIVKEKNYYIRYSKVGDIGRGKPVISVWLLLDSNGYYHRGISICSKKDVACKAVGRKIARVRAIKAMYDGHNSLPIGRDEALEYDMLMENEGLSVEFKSEACVDLTDFEMHLMSKGAKCTDGEEENYSLTDLTEDEAIKAKKFVELLRKGRLS